DARGDPLPDGAVARLGTTRLRPGDWIRAMAFAPDGKRLAVWGQERLTIYDTATGRELRRVELPLCDLLRLSWLADGRGVAVVNLGESDYYVWEFTDERAALPRRPGAAA